MTRIQTTHIGSLPGPPGFKPQKIEGLREAVAWVVGKQRAIGIDLINEGELTKGGDWLGYLDERFAGFEPRTGAVAKPLIHQGLDREKFAEFYQYAAERKTLFYAEDERMTGARTQWVCTGPITYQGTEALNREIEVFRAAVTDTSSCFITSTAPSSLEPYRSNAHYKSEEDFVFALAEALRTEYEAIVNAGFSLQVDDAWLVALWDRIGVSMGLEKYLAYCTLRVDALNHALRNLPEERIRYHLCWGSWHGPHAFDLPMADIVSVMLRVKARTYLFEAANPRHEHEFVVWDEVKLPGHKVIAPGCVTHSTDIVEHPELVAQRIDRFAQRVGRDRVVASTDCGFAGRCHHQVAWAKLESLARGAEIASR